MYVFWKGWEAAGQNAAQPSALAHGIPVLCSHNPQLWSSHAIPTDANPASLCPAAGQPGIPGTSKDMQQ